MWSVMMMMMKRKSGMHINDCCCCCMYAVVALFSHENLYSFGPYVDGYWTAIVRLNCCDSPFGDGLETSFPLLFLFRALRSHYTAHAHILSVFFIMFVLLQHTHTHTRIHTRFNSLLQLFCHVTQSEHFYCTLLYFWYYFISYLYFLLSSRILFLFSLQFVCHNII